jgi:glycolate oxidase iron-sulfur subunit
MQTHFSAARLADPDIADAESILRACVHCGFCTATCPTYLLTGDELDGPRGRIYLIKEMFEKDKPADPVTVHHLDRCLTCVSCMTTCPSGVNYMHLMDHARHHIERTYQRPAASRWLRAMLSRVLGNPALFRTSLRLAGLARPFRSLMPASLRALLDSAPRPASAPVESAAPPATSTDATRRVALMPGCVQQVLRPQIDAAAERVLRRADMEVVCPKGAGCCGALAHHLGQNELARQQAAANIEALDREIEARGLEAIVITASGCGTVLKDYGFMFRNDPALAAKATRISALARDVTEVLAAAGTPDAAAPAASPMPGLRVAYHSACSLQHGQRVTRQPKELLGRAGFEVLDVPEAHICCGSAGTYSMLQPEMSAQLATRKARHIESVQPQLVATGNIGCLEQISRNTRLPVVHTVELLDWAGGGPKPAALKEIP